MLAHGVLTIFRLIWRFQVPMGLATMPPEGANYVAAGFQLGGIHGLRGRPDVHDHRGAVGAVRKRTPGVPGPPPARPVLFLPCLGGRGGGRRQSAGTARAEERGLIPGAPKPGRLAGWTADTGLTG